MSQKLFSRHTIFRIKAQTFGHYICRTRHIHRTQCASRIQNTFLKRFADKVLEFLGSTCMSPISQKRKESRAKESRPTVQLKIIEATRAALKKIFFEKFATKKDHLIKQYIDFRRIVFYRRHWFKKGSIGK